MGAASLPEMVKPAHAAKQSTFSAAWLSGVLEDGTWRKISKEPGRPVVLSRTLTAKREYITLTLGRRESERPILAMKGGNSRGAKGLYCCHAFVFGRGEPLPGRDSRPLAVHPLEYATLLRRTINLSPFKILKLIDLSFYTHLVLSIAFKPSRTVKINTTISVYINIYTYTACFGNIVCW